MDGPNRFEIRHPRCRERVWDLPKRVKPALTRLVCQPRLVALIIGGNQIVMVRFPTIQSPRRRRAAGCLLALGLLASPLFPLMSADTNLPAATRTELATLGGGCFWCLEALLQTLLGVKTVTSGYAGGHTENPTYPQVCCGDTGHAEVVQVAFDPEQISFAQLLDAFWDAHDPTTLNRQGPDVGTQYRSIILHHNDAQRAVAEKSRQAAGKKFTRPIVTELAPLTRFYAAEQAHQDFFRRNPNQAYCALVIRPKLEKFRKRPSAP